MNGLIIHQIQQIPHYVLASALPHLRPFDAHHELRRSFTAWVAGTPQEFDSWQNAWNIWTRAIPGHPGMVDLRTTCSDCHGRMFSTKHGIPGPCTTCMGRRTQHIRTPALWQHPPDATTP